MSKILLRFLLWTPSRERRQHLLLHLFSNLIIQIFFLPYDFKNNKLFSNDLKQINTKRKSNYLVCGVEAMLPNPILPPYSKETNFPTFHLNYLCKIIFLNTQFVFLIYDTFLSNVKFSALLHGFH